MKVRYVRYAASLMAVAAALALTLLVAFPRVAGDAGAPAALLGVTVAAVSDVATFAILSRAVRADARGFARLWGLSVFLKASLLGMAIATVAASRVLPVDGFVRTLIAAFVVFSHHEIVWFARAQRAAERTGARACS